MTFIHSSNRAPGAGGAFCLPLCAGLVLALAGLVSGCGAAGVVSVGSGRSGDGTESAGRPGSNGAMGAQREQQELLDVFRRADDAIRSDAQNPVLHLDKARAAIDLAAGQPVASDRLGWYGELRSTVETYERIPASIRRSQDPMLDSLLLAAWTLEMESALASVKGRWPDLKEQDGQAALAMSHLDNAMMILPERPEAYEMAGALTYTLDQPNQALGLLLRGVTMTEGEVSDAYREKLAYLHLELGDIEEALMVLEPVMEQGQPARQTTFAYVNALILSGRSTEAVEWLEALLEDDPGDANVRHTLASETAALMVRWTLTLLEEDEEDLLLDERLDRLGGIVERSETLVRDIGSTPDPDIDLLYVIGVDLADAANQLETNLPSVPDGARATVLDLSQRLMRQALPLWEQLYAARPECEEAYSVLLGIYRSLGMAAKARDLQLNHQG